MSESHARLLHRRGLYHPQGDWLYDPKIGRSTRMSRKWLVIVVTVATLFVIQVMFAAIVEPNHRYG